MLTRFGMDVPWCFVLLVLALVPNGTIPPVSAQITYEIPPVCEGQTPVRYLGIQTEGGQPQAEQSLGIKLNSGALDIVRIYTTLDLHQLQDEDNQTETVQFAPGKCPGHGQLPVSKMINGTANLAYVWARSTTYASTYLRIQAPTRYYSLGTLSKKEAWKAKDNQTLQLAVSSDSRSRDCWQASNTHQRTAFIHRLLNRTLTKILQQVNRHVQWLDGTLYVRVEGENTLFNRWPFPFGTDYAYESCQTSLIPLFVPLDNSSSPNYTVCSHWSAMGYLHAWIPEDLAMFFNIFYYVACCIVFFYSWPWLYGYSYKRWRRQILEKYPCEVPNDERKFQVRNLKTVESGSKALKYFRNCGFPEQLDISHLLRAEGTRLHGLPWELKHLTKKLVRLPSTAFNPILYLVSAVMIVILLAMYVTIGSSYASGQEFDSRSNIWSPCSQPGWSAYVVVATILVFLLITFLLALCAIDYNKSEAKRGWSDWKNNGTSATAVIGGLSFFIMLLVPFILVPLIANLIMIFGFTLVGLLSFYRYELLTFIAVSKFIIFDLLKVTQVNRILSPFVQDCKYAIDEAARQLEEEMVSASAVRLANSMDESQAINRNLSPILQDCKYATGEAACQPVEEMVSESTARLANSMDKSQATTNADTLHKQFDLLFGFADQLPSRTVVSRINWSMTRAFLILWFRSRTTDVDPCQSRNHSWKSRVPLLFSPGSNAVDGSNCVYNHIYHKLKRGILKRYRTYVAQSVGGLFALLGCLFMLQLILVHISQLTNVSSWLQLLIPASIVLQTIIDHFKTNQKKSRDIRSELVLQAKSILLLFISKMEEGSFAADPVDGSIVIKEEKKRELSS